MAVNDGDSFNQIKSGSLCAVVSGCWDSQVAAEAFGDDYAGCKPVKELLNVPESGAL